MENTWGLKFVQIGETEFIDLFGVNCGTEQSAKEQFERIKRLFPTGNNDECTVDLVDEDDSIYDDHGLSYEQVEEIAKLMGQKIVG